MNFQPELAEKVMAGEKTVTRRLCSDNPRSPWFVERCSLQVNRTYAVCPGRGKAALGRVRIIDVTRRELGLVDDREAKLEGFANWERFYTAWQTINGGYDVQSLVWRVEFALVHPDDYALWESAA